MYSVEICAREICEMFVYKQTFHISPVRISQKLKGVLREIFNLLFSYEDEDMDWFSNLH